MKYGKMHLKENNMMKKYLLSFFLFCCPLFLFSQKLDMRDYVVLSFEQKDINGRDTLYWIAEIDSIIGYRFKVYPIYKRDLPISTYNVERFSKGDTIWYANSDYGSDTYMKYPHEFYDIISKNRYYVQKITKNWIKKKDVYYGLERGFRGKSTTKVYVSFVRGVFLRGVIGVEDLMNAEKLPYYRTYYIPYSDFSVIERDSKWWVSCLSFFHYMDYSQFNYTESKAEADMEGMIDAILPIIEERVWWKKKTK